MGVKTRSTRFRTPSTSKFNTGTRTSRKRVRFFDAWDHRTPSRTLRGLEREFGLTHLNGQRWLDQRAQYGSPVYHRTRKLSEKLGPPSKVSPNTYKILVSLSKNLVCDQQYEAQIVHYNLPIKTRTLQKRLQKHTKGGQRYKMAYVQKKISWKNKRERIHYNAAHLQHTIYNFWQFVFFTDKAHLDPSSQSVGYTLREEGHRLDPKNIQERGEKTGVKFHVARWCNW